MFGNDQFTKLLLHCDGTNGSGSFPDVAAGTTPHSSSVAGVTVSTAQSMFGGASGFLNGTNGNGIALDGSADFAFVTGDFTVDFWVRLASVAANAVLYDSRPIATDGFYPTIYFSTAGGGVIKYFTNGIDCITGTTIITVNTWFHIALARSGTSTKLFVNGTQEGSTFSDSLTYLNGGSRPILFTDGPGLTFPVNGFMDEIRVSKGIARWTANFTTPAEPYDVPANPNTFNNYSDTALVAQMSRPVAVPYY